MNTFQIKASFSICALDPNPSDTPKCHKLLLYYRILLYLLLCHDFFTLDQIITISIVILKSLNCILSYRLYLISPLAHIRTLFQEFTSLFHSISLSHTLTHIHINFSNKFINILLFLPLLKEEKLIIPQQLQLLPYFIPSPGRKLLGTVFNIMSPISLFPLSLKSLDFCPPLLFQVLIQFTYDLYFAKSNSQFSCYLTISAALQTFIFNNFDNRKVQAQSCLKFSSGHCVTLTTCRKRPPPSNTDTFTQTPPHESTQVCIHTLIREILSPSSYLIFLQHASPFDRLFTCLFIFCLPPLECKFHKDGDFVLSTMKFPAPTSIQIQQVFNKFCLNE